jgi:hypothetical protein
MTGMPRLMLAGLVVVAAGGGADVLHHALPAAEAVDLAPYLGHDGGVAHAVTFAGMVLTMAGLFSRRFASAPTPAVPVTIADPERNRRNDHAVR